MDALEVLQGTLSYIDRHLTEDISACSLAARAGYSEYHFCRLFQWGVGYSVMDYVRTRRLDYAARALASGERILDIALTYGFETHSGFSKAFRRRFSCTPESYRRHAHFSLQQPPNLSRMKNYRIGGIVMEPKFVTLPSVILAGHALRTSVADNVNKKSIPEFWNDYMADGRMARLHGEPFVKSHAEYGACFQEDPASGEFDYVIGVETKEGAAIPDPYDVYELPGATYAVFSTPPCNAGNFTATIQGVWEYIFNDWFPKSGYEYAAGCADYELYDERCMSEKGKICDIYVPVVKKV